MRRIAPALAVFLLALPAGAAAQSTTDPIVFVSFRDVHVINPDGSGQAALTASDNWTSHNHPAWSPDRTKIAVSRTSGAVEQIRQIHVMDADGSNLVNLSNLPDNTRADSMPAWSPDGTRMPTCAQAPTPRD